MKPMHYLKSRNLDCVDMLEGLRRGLAHVAASCTEGVLIAYQDDLYALAADNLAACHTLLQGIRPPELVLHGHAFLGEVMSLCGYTQAMPCAQVAYLGPGFAPQPDMRTIGLAETDKVYRYYHEHTDREYLEQRILAGVLQGCYRNGQLAGFAGLHAEGSMGMLTVLPSMRRQGIGRALTAHLINLELAKGNIPYGHIVLGNQPSMALNQAMGMQFANNQVIWLH